MAQQQIEEFLSSLFHKIYPYDLSSEESKKVSRDKAGFILDKLTRKKYRRKITEGAKRKLRNKIELAIKNNKPIHFTIPFGGYKHFWSKSHPEPDWAELFNLKFLTEYVLPILAVHKPGVILEYISEDLILSRMNNYPEEALESYSKAFSEIINWYKQYVPENLDIRYFRVGERFSREKIIEEVEKIIPERIAEFSKLTDEEKKQELHRSVRSIMWDGDQDLTNLSNEEKQRKIAESRVVELAYYDTEASPEFLGNYLCEDDHITICFSFGCSPDNVFEDLTLASCWGCLVDYWIGVGILEVRGERFIPKIISQNQYEELRENLADVKISQPSIDLKNFKSIEVLEI